MNEEILRLYYERTIRHIELVNLFMGLIGKSAPDHDRDKLFNNNVQTGALLRHKLAAIKQKPNESEQADINLGIFEHFQTAKHHPEHWIPRDLHKNWTPGNIARGDAEIPAHTMPFDAIDEMCADWCAMSVEFENSPLGWFDQRCIGNKKRWIFEEHQLDYIRVTLNYMWEKYAILQKLPAGE